MRQKILNENYLTALQRTRLVEKLTQLKQKYFTGSTLRQVKRTIQTSKSMKQLCHVVWDVICLFLGLEKDNCEVPLLDREMS